MTRFSGTLLTKTCLFFLLSVSGTVLAQNDEPKNEFPATPQVFADDPLTGCEGISFSGEGRLFVTCNRAFWEISIDGVATKLVDLDSNLGTAGFGARDTLVADFGPTNAFRDGRNSDGVIWRITPEGDKTAVSRGIGDPNFVLVMKDGSYLVTDDATADIYRVGEDGIPNLWSTAVNHPNGLALSADGSTLYVAQIFTNIRPVVFDDAIWSMKIAADKPLRDAKLAVRTGPNSAVDGLAMDKEGRVYIAANGAGQLWRFDPSNDEMVLIAAGMFGIASLAFGEGDFDHQSIYATATFSGGRGGKIWRIPVGTEGAALYR